MPLLTPIPTLDALAEEPERALGLSREVGSALMAKLSAAQMALARWALELPANGATPPEPDRALTLSEAAERAQLSPATLKRWVREKPDWRKIAVIRSGNKVRLSAHGLEALLSAGSTPPDPVAERGVRAKSRRPAPISSGSDRG